MQPLVPFITRLLGSAGLAGLVLLAGTPLIAGDGATSLVVVAPGYPGNTEAAQPTMDALAAEVARASGWKPGRLRAEYHSTLEDGLAALGQEDATLALVGLPFYLKYRDQLTLKPLLQVTLASGETERFTLVARRGALSGPQSLDGWQIHGIHGYAPTFVTRVLLGDWGTLPDTVEIKFTSRIVSSMRKAVQGDNVAVLLDQAQTEALPGLPFAKELETVARSEPLVASMLCSVGDRLTPQSAKPLLAAFSGLDASAEGRAVLESIRMQRFREADAAGLSRHEAAFAATKPANSKP